MNKFSKKDEALEVEKLSNKKRIQKLNHSLDVFFEKYIDGLKESLNEFNEYLNTKDALEFYEGIKKSEDTYNDFINGASYRLVIVKKDQTSTMLPDGSLYVPEDIVLQISANRRANNDSKKVTISFETFSIDYIELEDSRTHKIAHKSIDDALAALHNIL